MIREIVGGAAADGWLSPAAVQGAYDLSVVNVELTARFRSFCELVEIGDGTNQFGLEFVPLRALVATCSFPFGKLIVRQRVELHAGLAQYAHRVGTC